VLEKAGASLHRDAADKRLISGIRDRTHRRIDSQDEVGGWPQLKSKPSPTATTTATTTATRTSGSTSTICAGSD